MPIDLNFYPERHPQTLEQLLMIVIDCDLTGWTYRGLVQCAVETDGMLWTALNRTTDNGDIVPRWK